MGIKKIHVTLHIDDKTGKVVKATSAKADKKGKQGKQVKPGKTITHSIKSVVATNSPSCYYVKIRKKWRCFC